MQGVGGSASLKEPVRCRVRIDNASNSAEEQRAGGSATAVSEGWRGDLRGWSFLLNTGSHFGTRGMTSYTPGRCYALCVLCALRRGRYARARTREG